MSFERALNHLKKYHLEDRVMKFEVSSATVSEAARAINCNEENIVKTLSFIINNQPIIIAVSGNSKIDNSKYKEQFHTKAKMIPFAEVEKLIGHAVGGVCPFGINDDVIVYLDVSLKNLNIMYPACGSSNSAVKLTLKEIEQASNYKSWVDVCKY